MTHAADILRLSEATWKKDHARAMECRDLEDLIQVGLSIYHVIRTLDEQWARREADRKGAEEIRAAYEWWYRPCPDLLKAIRAKEAQHYSVAGASEFRKACEHVSGVLSVDLDRLYRTGPRPSRPLAEIRDELQGRTGR